MNVVLTHCPLNNLRVIDAAFPEAKSIMSNKWSDKMASRTWNVPGDFNAVPNHRLDLLANLKHFAVDGSHSATIDHRVKNKLHIQIEHCVYVHP